MRMGIGRSPGLARYGLAKALARLAPNASSARATTRNVLCICMYSRSEKYRSGLTRTPWRFAAADNNPFVLTTQHSNGGSDELIECASNSEAKMDNIGILDRIILAFEAELAGFLALGFAAVSDEFVVGDDLSANEAAFDVAMNLARRLLCHSAPGNCPGTYLVFPRGKKTDQIEKRVGSTDEALACRLVDADLLQKCYAITFVQLGDFHLHFTGQR